MLDLDINRSGPILHQKSAGYRLAQSNGELALVQIAACLGFAAPLSQAHGILRPSNRGERFMRLKTISITAAVAAIALGVAACGGSDARVQKLAEMCKKSDPKPESCECQAKVIAGAVDSKVIDVIVAMAETTEKYKDKPDEMMKAMQEVISKSGMKEEDIGKAMTEAEAKVKTQLEACKK